MSVRSIRRKAKRRQGGQVKLFTPPVVAVLVALILVAGVALWLAVVA